MTPLPQDVVVDANVLWHCMNPSSGRQTESADFVAGVIDSTIRICLDSRGFIVSEYEPLAGKNITSLHIAAFIRTLATPGRASLIDDRAMSRAKGQFIGRLRIDPHDKPYLRTATASSGKWLVSNDSTFEPHVNAIQDHLNVRVDDSAQGLAHL